MKTFQAPELGESRTVMIIKLKIFVLLSPYQPANLTAVYHGRHKSYAFGEIG